MSPTTLKDTANIPLVFYRLAAAMLWMADEVEQGTDWRTLVPNVEHAIYKLGLAKKALRKGPTK